MSKNKNLALQKELEDIKVSLKRALADYANLEKRVAAERELMTKLILAKIVLKFLPVLDNLEKALQHVKDDGIKMTAKQFRQVLESEGVKELGSVGEKFNPEFHEAVEIVEGRQDNLVIEVLNPGFAIDGQVIRPAKVKVEKTKVDKVAEEKAEKAADFGDYA